MSQQGTLIIDEFQIQCIIGILPEERIETQCVFLSLEMDCDFTPFVQSEKGEFVDYVEVTQFCEKILVQEEFELIETAVCRLATEILNHWSAVLGVKVCLNKPCAIPKAKATKVQYFKSRI